MLRILLASPYPALRAGLRVLLEGARPVAATVVGEADSVDACIEGVRDPAVDIVLYDLALEVDDELSGLWSLRAQSRTPVLALSEWQSDPRVLGALQIGARGCLPKTASGEELVEAALQVAGGETVLPPDAALALIDRLRDDAEPVTLSPRETSVLRLVAVGLTNKAIALRLGISEHTVKFHLGSAMSKLGAASRAEAVASAMRRGLISV